MAKILIAGCGDIGLRLAKLLSRQGHQMTGLRRNPPESHDGSLVYCKADMTRPGDLAQLDTDVDQIFFMPTPDGRTPEAYRAAYLTSLDNLLRRYSEQVPSPRWFLISSTSVYGQSEGEWVDEKSPAAPASETGNIIRQAEQRLMEEDTNHVIVRFSGIYGPGRERLIKMASKTPVIQRDPPYFTNRIHQDDCAAVLAYLSVQHLNGRPLDNCYLASDDQPAPLFEVIAWLAEKLKLPPPLPQSSSGNRPDQNKRCSNKRLKSLGYRFSYPGYRDGYRPLLDRNE